jgi:hypothetical protein
VNKDRKLGMLQSLLERVQSNARAPRVRAPHPAPEVEPAVEAGGGVAAAESDASLVSGVQVVTIAEEVSSVVVEALDEVVLLEEEIVELTPEPMIVSGVEAAEPLGEAAMAASADIDIDFDDVEDLTSQRPPPLAEEPPASSRRPKAATSMDEALAEAAEQHEVPIKTPPPESGPQAAVPLSGMAAPPAPEVDELLEEPTREPLGAGLTLDEPLSEPPEPQAAPLEPEVRRRPPFASGIEVASYERTAQEFKPKSFVELLDASLSLGS